MGRPFNESEKEKFKANLLEKGRELFAQNDLKRVSVGELTQAVGIAQGSFYVFYASKEELFFEILETEEKKIGAIIENELDSLEMTREACKQLLLKIVELITGNPFLKKSLNKEDYQILISKIPTEKFQTHLQQEYQLTERLATIFYEQKHLKPVKPGVLSGLLYALFLLQLHRDEIGEETFPDMFEFLVDIIADTLVNEGTMNFNETTGKYIK